MEVFDVNGTSLGKLPTIRDQYGRTIYSRFGPTLDLDVDATDTIHIATLDRRIVNLDSSGGFLSAFDPQMQSLTAITSDPKGVLYVGGSDAGFGTVKTFRNDGTSLGVFATGFGRQVVGVVVANVVPEPSATVLASSFFTLAAYRSARRKQS